MKLSSYMFPAAVALVLCSCTEDVMDRINRDDHNPTSDQVPVSIQITDAIMNTAFSTTSGDYSFYTSSLTEQEVGTGNNQFMHAELRNPVEWAASTTFNNTWNSTYANLLSIKEIIAKVEGDVPGSAGCTDVLGMAQVLWVVNFGILTDMHGDIPYSEALLGLENMTPHVDKQKDIYADLLSVIDKAIGNLETASSNGISNAGAQDIAYGGDVDAWLAAAHGVKARLLLHLSVVDPSSLSKALDEAQEAFTLGFRDFKVSSFNGVSCDNPWSAFYWSRQYTATSTTVTDLMGEDDPRLSVYTYDTGEAYAPGNKEVAADASGSLVYPMWIDNGAQPVTILGAPELYFIIAEIQARSGADATEAYRSGVAASVDHVYSVVDEAGEGAVYAATLATPTLQDVYTQKYLSQIVDGQVEAYNDIRRVAAGGGTYVTLHNPLNTQSGQNRWPELLPYANSAVISNPNIAPLYGDGYYIYTKKAYIFGGGE